MIRRSLVLVLVLVLVAIVAVPTSSQVARAVPAETRTWTSTADFDAGTKSSTADSLPGRWSMTGAMPIGVSDSPAFVIGSNLYLVGGYTTSSNAPSAATQIYNTVTRTWSAGGNLKTAVWGHAAAYCACTGKAYSFAGFTSSAYSAFRTTQIYDPTSNTWSNASASIPLNVAYEGMTAVTVASMIYVFNGSAAQKYNPALDSWTPIASPGANRGLWREGVTVGTFIYLIGGSALFAVVDRYDTVGDSYTLSYDTVPYAHYGGLRDGPGMGDGSTFYVGYGNDDVNFFATLYKYAPVTKTWTQQHAGGVARDGVGSGAVNGFLYVGGGRNAGNPGGFSINGIDYLEIFNPSQTTGQGYDVQTVTDNQAVPDGTFSLGNHFGDTFSFVREDGLTFPWTGKAGRANGVASGNGFARNMTRGVLDLRGEFLGGDYGSVDSVNALSTSSDIDVRVKFSSQGIANGQSFVEWQLFDQQIASWNAAAAGTGNGILFQNSAPTSTTLQICAFKIAAHAAAAIGVCTTPTLTSAYLRIALSASTNNWTVYWSATGSTWTTIGSVVFAVTGPVYAIMGELSSNFVQPWWVWDNYYVAKGTFTASSYRASGSWTSAVQPFDGTYAHTITLTYSGANATEYIAGVSVVDVRGSVIYRDASPVRSGTSYTVTIPEPDPHDPNGQWKQSWAVQIDLAGDGFGSVNVQQVDVGLLVLRSDEPVPVLWISVSCAYNSITLEWTCRDDTNYSGWAIVSLSWIYDGYEVASSRPRAEVSFSAVNSSWLDMPAGHRLVVRAIADNGGQPYATFLLQTDQTIAQLSLAGLVFIILVAMIAGRARRKSAEIYFEPFSNPNHRRTAIEIEEYPPGWKSYRQRPDEGYSRHRSEKRGKDLWIVYGIRPTNERERARTGRKYIAEVQTVRERIR